MDDNRFAEADLPSLTRHGGSSLIKLSPPFLESVRPFVGVGLGPSQVSVSGAAGGLYTSDFMEEVPVAAGLEFNAGAFTAGVRTTYRLLMNEDFADAALAEGGPSGGLFDAALTVGGRFSRGPSRSRRALHPGGWRAREAKRRVAQAARALTLPRCPCFAWARSSSQMVIGLAM